PSQEPVLSYTTDDPSPEPLRVAVVDDFTDGFGRMRTRAREPREGFRPDNALSGVPEEIPRDRRTLVVDANGVAAPQLAVPDNLASADVGGIAWSLGPDGTARVQRSPGTYSATFTELDIEEEHFDASEPTTIDPTADRDENLSLDPGSATQIQALAERLAPSGADDLAAAQAFQEYLRSPDFTYSLDIPRPEGGPSDPILSFLETKTGYCQQFAATMTLLARSHGIPSRVVVGFLPGAAVDDEEYLVRASDAHAWPELYFESVGWVRFEPTPGARAAGVPGYTINTESTDIATDETTSDTETTTTTTSAAPTQEEVAPPEPADEGWLRRWSGWILAVLLGAAALAILPVTAVLARRRERAAAHDDTARVEREWRDLIDRIGDLGVEPPSGATPRDVGAWLTRRAHLEAPVRDQLDHVVGTLERARYGRPGQDLPEVSAEVTAVVDEIRDQRMRSARVRAALMPRAGVDAWRALPRRLADRLRR
ncbi:MAG: transglutaminase-like domain-containing protein, partial [Janibacter sp.]